MLYHGGPRWALAAGHTTLAATWLSGSSWQDVQRASAGGGVELCEPSPCAPILGLSESSWVGLHPHADAPAAGPGGLFQNTWFPWSLEERETQALRGAAPRTFPSGPGSSGPGVSVARCCKQDQSSWPLVHCLLSHLGDCGRSVTQEAQRWARPQEPWLVQEQG